MEDGCAPLRNWTKSVDRANWEMKDGRTDGFTRDKRDKEPPEALCIERLPSGGPFIYKATHSIAKGVAGSYRNQRIGLRTPTLLVHARNRAGRVGILWK